MAQDMFDLGGCSWMLETNVYNCNHPSWYWKAWFVLSLIRFLILFNRSVCNPPSRHCSLCYTEAASSHRDLDSVSVHQPPSCGCPFSLLIFQHTSPSRTPPKCPLHSTLVLTLFVGTSPLLGCPLLFPLMRLWYPTPSHPFAVTSSLSFSGSDLHMLVLSIVWRPSPSP